MAKNITTNMLFDKRWFQKHQKILLWMLNTKLFFGLIQLWFRWILCINGNRSSVRNNKILKIEPNSIIWFTGRYKKDKRFKNPQDHRLALFSAEFRTHDKFAKRLYYAFKPLWHLFHFWDINFANPFVPTWNLGFDTTGDLFSSAGDGYTENANATYATCHDAASGSAVAYTGASDILCQNDQDPAATYRIRRAYIPFLTSSIGSGATITAATLSLFGTTNMDASIDDTIRVIQTSQASTSILEVGDFSLVGTTGGGDLGLISAMLTAAYNNVDLNATGLTWISTTASTLLGIRMLKDINSTSPANLRSYAQFRASEQAGTTNDPKLVVTYTPAAKSGFFTIFA